MSELGIVIPAYNEAQVLPEFHRRLSAALRQVTARVEIIYVDDGSFDRTPDALRGIQQGDHRVGVVRLSRNFGKELALCAGLQTVRAAAVIVIDADLQDPPERISAMVAAWRGGADVVNMKRRRRRGESFAKRASAHAFYRVLKRLSGVPIPEDVGDFRLLSRRAVDAVNSMPERLRYTKGLFAWLGFPQVTLEYDRDSRSAGVTKQSYRRLFGLAVEGITSFSVAPLRAAFFAGLLIGAGAFAMTIYFVAKTLWLGEPVQGFPTLVVAVLTLGGLNLMGLGVVGEYIGRMYMEVKQRPHYLVDRYEPPLSHLAPVAAVRRATVLA